MALATTLLFTACGSEDDSTSTTTIPDTIVNQPADISEENRDVESDTSPELVEEVEIPIEEITELESLVPSKYYGTWSYVHSGEEINIISTTDLDITEVADDEKLTNNLLNTH